MCLGSVWTKSIVYKIIRQKLNNQNFLFPFEFEMQTCTHIPFNDFIYITTALYLLSSYSFGAIMVVQQTYSYWTANFTKQYWNKEWAVTAGNNHFRWCLQLFDAIQIDWQCQNLKAHRFPTISYNGRDCKQWMTKLHSKFNLFNIFNIVHKQRHCTDINFTRWLGHDLFFF